jgi:hypothetical protein
VGAPAPYRTPSSKEGPQKPGFAEEAGLIRTARGQQNLQPVFFLENGFLRGAPQPVL